MATSKFYLVILLTASVILCSGPCWSARNAIKKKKTPTKSIFEHQSQQEQQQATTRKTFSVKTFVNQTSYLKLTNICAENSTACYNISPVRGKVIDRPDSPPPREVSSVFKFPEEKSQIRLNNGTVLRRQPLEESTSASVEKPVDSSADNAEETPPPPDFITSEEENSDDEFIVDGIKIDKKMLPLDDGDSSESSSEFGTNSRVIGYRLGTRKKPVNTTRAVPPTITLAQLAKRIIFPDWLWNRFAVDRKTGISAFDIVPNQEMIPTIRPPQMPTITFDNNFSKFMKLFTTVKFRNSQCFSPAGQNGTCYQSQECTNMGGTPTAPCAQGFGVCCVFLNKCGDTTSKNGTYFIDNAMKFSKGITTCTLRVQKVTPFIRQMRIDFHIFTLQSPNAGNCDIDRFVLSGQNTNNVIPILCGQNSGSHIYVETDGPFNGIQLSIMTTGEGPRRWSIRITQYETIDHSGAPSHCLQYHTGVMGRIHSFNYDSDSSPQYLNNLNYALCIRKEAGFCSITFSNSGPDSQYYAFQIVNANEQGNLVLPSGQAGVGIRDCPYDYILLNGYRLCGERLNDASTGIPYVEDAPVTDISNGPFMINVRTNEIDVGGGFSLYYRQNPCMSSPG